MPSTDGQIIKYCERQIRRTQLVFALMPLVLLVAFGLFRFAFWIAEMEMTEELWLYARIFIGFCVVMTLLSWLMAFLCSRSARMSPLIRDALGQTGFAGERLQEAFDQINTDISLYGEKYGPLYIGRKWMFGGGRALELTNIANLSLSATLGKNSCLTVTDRNGKRLTVTAPYNTMRSAHNVLAAAVEHRPI